jgi:hypothetical protein
MDTLAVKTAIKNALVAAGAQNLFTVEPRLEDLSDLIDKVMQRDGQFLQYWIIRRAATIPETSDTLPGYVPMSCIVRWMQRFAITLYIAYQEADEDREASSDHFDRISDQVLSGMAPNRTLNGAGWNMFRPLALIEIMDDRLSDQFLCHRGTFALELIDDQEVQPY